MPLDPERVRRVSQNLREMALDAAVVSLPRNVLLLSGYWPVVGSSIAVVTKDGVLAVIAPEDERELAEEARADVFETFRPGSLDSLAPVAQRVEPVLREVLTRLGLSGARIGSEDGDCSEPASYAAMHLYGRLSGLIASACRSTCADISDAMARWSSAKTSREIERIRLACRIAQTAFENGMDRVKEGMTEIEAAQAVRALLSTAPEASQAERAGGYVYCMSGPNAATAYRSYQRSRTRRLREGDAVLVHCNGYVDGYWNDVTRTYVLGEPDARHRSMHEAIHAAREVALAAVKPGATGAQVDAAARAVIRSAGYGEEFLHPTGHGTGFSPIDHNQQPRLHPLSDDVLREDMIFNIEPGIYFAGQTGMRHCDMVLVTAGGCEVLTPFHASAGVLQMVPT